MKSATFISLCILVCRSILFGQVGTLLNDTTAVKITKRPGLAITEILGTNIILNRFNANVRNVDWAKVTPQAWQTNLSQGFHTDFDNFSTNWLGHPYTGSLYYNAARSNGYNFWQSIPFTAAGSIMWEYFGETCLPSKLDVITTTVGGIYVGEVMHRITEIIKQKIKKPVLKHTFITLVNPIGEINSLIVKDNKPSDSNALLPLIKGQLSIGGYYSFGQTNEYVWGAGGNINLSLIYGDLFTKTKKPYRPFDYFTLKSWLNISPNNNDIVYLSFMSHAPLFVKHINKNSVISISQHYDYLTNSVYKIGSLAVTADYSFQHSWHPKNFIVGSVKAGVILFGSSKSEIVNFVYHSTDPEFFRDYVYGNGFKAEADVIFNTKKFGRLSGNFNNWMIYTSDDTKGYENLSMVIIEYDYPIGRKFNVGLQTTYYQRLAHYNAYPEFRHITNDYYEFKATVGMTF